MTGLKKVLIVDDEKPFCDALSDYLRRAGYETFFALNSGDAIEAVKTGMPDFMTLDLRLPGPSGMFMQNSMTALAEAKKVKKDLRVIIVSAMDFGGDMDYFRKMGADAFQPKPVDMKLLLDTMEKLANG